MTLLWADGFDHYGASADFLASGEYVYTTNNASQPIQIGTNPAYIRTGGHYWDTSGIQYDNWYGGRLVGGTANKLGAGAAFFFPGPPSRDNYCLFMFNTTNKDTFQCSLRLNPDGSLSVNSGKDGGSFGTTGPGVIVWGAYAYVEMKVVCSAGAGTIDVRVNNNPVLSVAGVNTDPSVTGTLTGVMTGIRSLYAGGSSVCFAVSDFVIWDGQAGLVTDFMGDIRCRTIYPNANGGTQDWLANGDANAFQCVAHVPPIPATNFISGAAVGNISNFGLQSIPTNTSAIFGVRLSSFINKSDAGVCTVQAGIDSNGSIANGPAISPGTGAARYSSVFEYDPQGGAAFTYQRVNTLKARVIRTA
jgi:hypothetical protein